MPLQLKRRPSGMGVLTTHPPIHTHTQEEGLLVHKESADHLCCPRVTLYGCHTQAFITLAIQRLVSFSVVSVLGCCTPSFNLCKDFNTLSRGCLGSLWVFFT